VAHTKIKNSEFTYRKNLFWGVVPVSAYVGSSKNLKDLKARGEDGTSEGGSGACRPKQCPEPLERCCGGGLLRWSRVQRRPASRPAAFLLVPSEMDPWRDRAWGCSACQEPRWPWRPREGCYMLARCRVGSTLDLNRSGPAASRHHFALRA